MNLWDSARSDLDGLPDGAGLNMAHEAVDRHVRAGNGDRVALRFIAADGTVRPMTYGELADLTARFANAITALGVQPGDAVATILGSVPELFVAVLGALKAGCVAVPLFTAFGPEPLRARLAKSRARVLVTTRAIWQRKVAAERPRLPELTHVVLTDGAETDTASWDSLLADADPAFAIPPTDPETPALLHFTSGTTGEPKGALHAHDAVVAHLATARQALSLRPGDIFWCTADPGWVTGISYGVIAPLVCGATAVAADVPLDAAAWSGILEAQRVAVWYTAPTAIRMLRRAGTPSVRLPALRHAACVGEPLDGATALWGETAFGQPFHDTWWQTETGAIMIANPPDEPARPNAMGRPLPDVLATVIHRNPDGGVEMVLTPGTIGELALVVGWPSMFRGYLDDDDRYRRCFASNLYLSGDLVRRDADGWLHFVGRSDDVIKTAGHLVGPFEVERTLLAHPGVAEAGVVGEPDALLGERVHAFVTPRPGYAGDDALRRDLLAHARRRLGAAVAPRTITFADELPKTPSGKILRRQLKERAADRPDDGGA